jgi:N-acetylmuramic acid 6-phosphate etherase
MKTERRNPRSYGLDRMSALEIVRLMDEEEHQTLHALERVEAEVAQVASRVSRAFLDGGRVIYVGAGTSGRIATMDAAEMPPTFGVETGRFLTLIAGGDAAGRNAIEGAEDDIGTAIDAINDMRLTKQDVVIGLAASGTTPFVVTSVSHASQKGVWTCGIANNPDTPLLVQADLGIYLDTGPEVLTGSTRLKAGTSQKLVLNRISTAAMVLSGKVIQNLMVDVKPKNAKLRERCSRIVCELTNLTRDEATKVLEENHWSIRAALAAVAA